MKKSFCTSVLVISSVTLSGPNSAHACDRVQYEALQHSVTEFSLRCQLNSDKFDKLQTDYRTLRARYRKASNSQKRILKPKLDRLKARVTVASKNANKVCTALTTSSETLDTLAQSCLSVFNSPDNETIPGTGEPPSIDETLPDTPHDPSAPLPAEVTAIVQKFTENGFVVTLHGDTSTLASTIFDVTISGYRFLFYPNGIIWYPADDLFLIRDYFDNSVLRAVRFKSQTAREFITGSILANVPGALAVRDGNVFLIYKVKESPTVGFGILKTNDGSEYLVYPQDYNAVIIWMFPEQYYLNLLKFQIISNLLTAQYNTALQIFSNFPGSGTTVEYIY